MNGRLSFTRKFVCFIAYFNWLLLHLSSSFDVSPYSGSFYPPDYWPSEKTNSAEIRANSTNVNDMVNIRGDALARNFLSSQRQKSKKLLRQNRIAPVTIRQKPPNEQNLEERPPDPNKVLSSKQIHDEANRLKEWISSKKSVLCITGAGLSTDSGIVDYRGFKGSYHSGHKPMIHSDFINRENARKRYWGRSLVGWRSFAETQPNTGHLALTELESMGMIGVEFKPSTSSGSDSKRLSIITQNVDRLHSKAGTKNIIELHGRSDDLVCLNCGNHESRWQFHTLLETINSDFLIRNKILNDPVSNQTETTKERYKMRPDGDAEILTDFSDMHIPGCSHCESGVLKPDVVFFGDSVPKERVNLCMEALESADALLCVGTSLAVYSAFRFVKAAASSKKHIG